MYIYISIYNYFYFHFYFLKTLIKLYIKNYRQHNKDILHGIIIINIKNI